MILPSSFASLSWNGTRVGSTAAVERAHSDRARSGSKESARVSFHPFHRAPSASKKDSQAAPLPPFSGRACTSTRDSPGQSITYGEVAYYTDWNLRGQALYLCTKTAQQNIMLRAVLSADRSNEGLNRGTCQGLLRHVTSAPALLPP